MELAIAANPIPWPTSLAAAYVKAQAEMPSIDKGKTARVDTKSGGSYSYSYADLADALDAIRPILAKHGLAVVQDPVSRQRSIDVFTTLLHESGECMSFGPLTFPTGDTPQAVGSAITYARRYALLAALGLATEDDDGQTARTTPSTPAGSTKKSTRGAKGTPAPPRQENAPERMDLPAVIVVDEWSSMPLSDKVGFVGQVMGSIVDPEQRKHTRAGFIDEFPADPGLTEANIDSALDWLTYIGLVNQVGPLTPDEVQAIADEAAIPDQG
jgi:hypothetical protein